MAWNETNTIESGGDFNTIVLFESDHDGDTPTNGTLCTGEVKGNTESSTCYWGGWQSGQNATTRIVLTAQSGSETDGTDGSGDDAVVDSVQSIIESTNAFYIDITKLEFANTRIYVSFDNGGQIRIAKCFFRNHTSSTIDVGNVNSDITIKIGTCLFKDCGTNNYTAPIYINDSSITTTAEVFNCTMYTSENGVSEYNMTMKVRNCVSALADNNDFNSITDEDYCASEDTTAGGTNSITSITPADEWTSPGTGATADFTIKDTNSDIYHSGETRSESWFTSLCATDLVGTSWASPPSMGCFEYSGGGPAGNAPTGNIHGPIFGPLGGII